MVPKCKAGRQGSELVRGGLLGGGGVRGRWHPMHGSKMQAGGQGSDLVSKGLLGGGGSKRQVASDAWFQNAKQGGRGLIW